jgi:hypothetical protein
MRPKDTSPDFRTAEGAAARVLFSLVPPVHIERALFDVLGEVDAPCR